MAQFRDKPIPPQHMHQLRGDMVEWLADSRPGGGQDAWAAGYGQQDAYAERIAAKNWSVSLKAAGLTYASHHMTRTALAAGDAFDEYRLLPTDLPDPYGFIVWAEPITSFAKLEAVTGASITAATWAVRSGFVDIRWWSPKEEWLADYTSAKPRNNIPALSARLVNQARRMYPLPLIPTAMSTLTFQRHGSDWPDPKTHYEPGSSLADMAEMSFGTRRLLEAERALVATWKLMRQQLVTETAVEAPKSAVKRLGRLDPALLQAVRYVQLRHRHNAPAERGEVDGPKREYAHRWLVRGHWRTLDQGTQQQRDVWVREHMKGPDGAPILDPARLVQKLQR